jgi:general stress protein 26
MSKTLSVTIRWDLEVPEHLVEAFLEEDEGRHEEIWQSIDNWFGVDVPMLKGVKVSLDSVDVEESFWDE